MKKLLLLLIISMPAMVQSQMTVTVGSTVLDVDTIYYGTGSSGAYTGNNGMDIPWEIIYGSDDHLWVTERKGLISRIDPITKTKSIVLNLAGTVYQNSESGLLGMALHPDFENTPEVFIAYTYGNFSNIRERFEKYTFNGTSLVNPVVLLEDITGNTTHIGCRIHVLPDTTLLFSTGDAQNTSLPQNTGSLNGKILRLNMDGSVPVDNPIPGNYMYSYGHRNVQGIAAHPNGKIYLSEHGASTDDEFQILEMNRNYGWPNVEGFCDLAGEQTFCAANNVMEPITVWTPTIAPSDMVYYENPLIPELDGKVLMTVLKDKKLIAMGLNLDGTSMVSEVHYLTNIFGRLRDICVGPQKEIYLATNGASWSNTNPNTHSIIVLRTQDTEGVEETAESQIGVYPNPVGDQFTIKFSESMVDRTYTIIDMSGRIMVKNIIQSIDTKINSSFLDDGVYQLYVSGIAGAKKFVK
jgi:glucose/arabinose dehydrogenase